MYRAIDAALVHAKSDSLDVKPMEIEIENITSLAQAILKREWVRVKRGE